jgi:hypothetical protein
MLVASIVTYHAVAFISYALSDFAAWRLAMQRTSWEEIASEYDKDRSELLARSKLSQDDRDFIERHERSLGSIWRSTHSEGHYRFERAVPFVSMLRTLVDFALPMFVAIAALTSLARAW